MSSLVVTVIATFFYCGALCTFCYKRGTLNGVPESSFMFYSGGIVTVLAAFYLVARFIVVTSDIASEIVTELGGLSLILMGNYGYHFAIVALALGFTFILIAPSSNN